MVTSSPSPGSGRVLLSTRGADPTAWVDILRRDGLVPVLVPPGATISSSLKAVAGDLIVLRGATADVLADLAEMQAPGLVPIIVHLLDDSTPATVFLEAGADDCVPSATGAHELLARTHAILRRPNRRDCEQTLRLGHLNIDLERHTFASAGVEVHLAPKEFSLLELLLRRQGRLVCRADIIESVWGGAPSGNSKTLDVHIKRLRRKIEPIPSRPRYLLTVRGRGYRLVACRPGERHSSGEKP